MFVLSILHLEQWKYFLLGCTESYDQCNFIVSSAHCRYPTRHYVRQKNDQCPSPKLDKNRSLCYNQCFSSDVTDVCVSCFILKEMYGQ